MRYIVTIHPTFNCNFDCSFCSQRYNEKTSLLDLGVLSKTLRSLPFKITEICIMGGEVSILPDDYLKKLLTIVESYGVSVFIQTNLYKINPLLIKHNVIVSYDFNFRPYSDEVLTNILTLDRFNMTTIVTRNILSRDINELISFYSSFKNLNLLCFLPYNTLGEKDNQQITIDEYIDFIERFKNKKTSFYIPFNGSQLEEKDIVIMPSGDYYVSGSCLKCEYRDRCDIKDIIKDDAENCSYKKTFKKE